MKETLLLARALATASGRRLGADRLARHLRADTLLILVRDHELDLLVCAPGFPQSLPGGPTWDEFFARTQYLGVHDGTIAYPDSARLASYRALVLHDGVLMLIGGDPVVDEGLEFAAAFLIPLLRAEQIAIASTGRVHAAQEAARHATGLAAALDSARVDLERALRAKEEFLAKLQAANEERDRLLGIVGHDLRNPLAAITTSAALIARRGGLSEEQASSIRRIQRTSERMAEMIRGLLDRERIRTAGGVAIEPREVKIHELVRMAIEEARLAHPAIEFDMQCDVDDTAVWDPTRLAQVLSNLLGNAAQHGPRGASIRLRVEPSGEDMVALAVTNDLDAPIPAERLARLFEPFERGAKSAGLGLGLHIVSEIAKAHHGRASVTSDGRSICFRVELPRRETRGGGHG